MEEAKTYRFMPRGGKGNYAVIILLLLPADQFFDSITEKKKKYINKKEIKKDHGEFTELIIAK